VATPGEVAVTVPEQVLIVDDEAQTRKLLRTVLKEAGFRTTEARSAEEALAGTNVRDSDVVLLELDLPDADGIDIIKRLRKRRQPQPIIVVSARSSEDDKVRALEVGADDYVTKPFGTSELTARIRVALRRSAVSRSVREQAVLTAGDIAIDRDRRQVTVAGREVHLTPHEFEMLLFLMKHAGKVVTHPQLLEEVWGREHKEARAYLRVYMGQLRRKLERAPSRPRYLLTEPGIGYRLKAT
jgi:two-component system KDP operon response regulator KdpE